MKRNQFSLKIVLMTLLTASFLLWVFVPRSKVNVTLTPNGTLQLDSRNYETGTEFLRALKGRASRNKLFMRPVTVRVLAPSSAWPHSLDLMLEVANVTDNFTFQHYDTETGEVISLEGFSGEAVPNASWPQFRMCLLVFALDFDRMSQ